MKYLLYNFYLKWLKNYGIVDFGFCEGVLNSIV